MENLKLTIITPSVTLVDKQDILSINMKSIAGEMTIYKNHSPILTSLVTSKLHYTTNDSKINYVDVDSGIIKINKLEVIIIANNANFSKE